MFSFKFTEFDQLWKIYYKDIRNCIIFFIKNIFKIALQYLFNVVILFELKLVLYLKTIKKLNFLNIEKS